MDQQLKARLIGASVLVLIAVLLIPELLSGRKTGTTSEPVVDSARGTRTYTIDLGAATATGAGTPAPAPVVPAPKVESTRTNAATTSTGPKTAREQGAPADAAEVAGSIATPAAAGPDAAGATTRAPAVAPTVRQPLRRRWPRRPLPSDLRLQLPPGGAGRSRSGRSVRRRRPAQLVGELRQDGYDAYVAPLQRSGKTLHRVRVGPEDSRAAAERLAGRLQGRKLPVTVVANE